VDWQRIGCTAPRVLSANGAAPDAPLPPADVVVLTWTIAEWSALDHVFVNSSSTRTSYARDWMRTWHLYTRGAPAPPVPPAPPLASPLWGFYQLVELPGDGGEPLRVLLFKCDAHLAHPPWFSGLVDMLNHIFEDAQPRVVYSVGTAGGSRIELRLGDVVVTNSGTLKVQRPENAGAPNDQEFTCAGPFPSGKLWPEVESQFFFPMGSVVTYPALTTALANLHQSLPSSAPFSVADLVNAALAPSGLRDSRAVPLAGQPLLSTDFYFIGSGDDAVGWSALEMDDAVVGYAAGQHGIDWVFVRNISDPLVPSTAGDGTPVPDEVRDQWSGLIYQQYGLYTSYNGALTTWAAIAG
jgi:hypothetical protein